MIPASPVIEPKVISQVGLSFLFIERFIRMTMIGIVEQIMAARPLVTKTSAHETNPFPQVIIKNPRKAWMRNVSRDGNFSRLMRRKNPTRSEPATNCRIAANKNGGKCMTPIRITRNVVPQISEMPAKQK